MTKSFALHCDFPGHAIFQMKFTNGYVLSMNMGMGGYNDNRNIRALPETLENDRVECAVFDPEDKWVTKEFFPRAEDGKCSVVGWATMEDVQKAISEIIKK